MAMNYGQKATKAKQLTQKEKKEILAKLKTDYKLNGEHLKILTSVMDGVGYVDDGLTLLEIAGVISEGTLAASATSAISVTTLFFSPIGGILMLMNANESGERTYGMRAVAYTITAWTYDEPILAGSKRILKNMRTGFPTVSPENLKRYKKAWRTASDSILTHLKRQTNSGKISKKNMQFLLKALGGNKKRNLCLEILKGFEDQIPHNELKYWKSNYRTLYPF